MRRAIILFLLFLLPLEVFAGIAYELKIAREAQYSTGTSVSGTETIIGGTPSVESPVRLQDSLPASGNASLTTATSPLLDADSDLLLDLGEAFDLPCAFTEKSPSLITSPPGHFTYCDKSIVTAVPIRPAI